MNKLALAVVPVLMLCGPVYAQVPGDTSQAATQAQVAAALSAAQAAASAAAAAQATATAAQAAIPTTAAMAAAAPVQSVNTKTGTVAVPTLCRQQSAALAIPTSNPGSVSFAFPNATCSFASLPSCWMDISTTATGYSFDYPLNTARSTSAVTYSFTAHSNTLSILALGALSVTLGAPANSTVTMTCTAPPV